VTFGINRKKCFDPLLIRFIEFKWYIRIVMLTVSVLKFKYMTFFD